MSKLNDISFWHFFSSAEFKGDVEFLKLCAYIADAYQANLNGYKPHRTTRIGIYLSEKILWDSKPWFNGSICHLPVVFNNLDYSRLNQQEAKLYLLNLMHSTIIDNCEALKWEKEKFKNAYLKTIENNLEYIKNYPFKTSRSKQNRAHIIVKKTLELTIIFFRVNNLEIKVYEKKNEFWADQFDNFVSRNKWFDNDSFGINTAKNGFRLFYSLSKKGFGYQIDSKFVNDNNLNIKIEQIIAQINPKQS